MIGVPSMIDVEKIHGLWLRCKMVLVSRAPWVIISTTS
jgi:hypothetical protein